MRSTFAGLNTMVHGVQSNRLSLETVGHNISNANTVGYSRQSVNLAATPAQETNGIYGTQWVGTGVDSTSIVRARSVYADKQYWTESSTKSYYEMRQKNYEKVETFFNDTDSVNVQNSLEDFFKAWVDLSSNASTTANRTTVIEEGKTFADRVGTAASQLQDQMRANYDDIALHIEDINKMTDQIVTLNKSIMSAEATGASANDLRDSRDNLADKLATYMNINVYEDDQGMYQIVSNGTTIVGGINNLHLQVSDPVQNNKYGINDFNIMIRETDTIYQPVNGILREEQDAIEEQKGYIDKLSNMAAFMLTTLNDQHKKGAGNDTEGGTITLADGTTTTIGTTGVNFYGNNDTVYTWNDTKQCVTAVKYADGALAYEAVAEDSDSDGTVDSIKVQMKNSSLTPESTTELDGINVIDALKVNAKLTATNGEQYVAARSWALETNADGTGVTGSVVPNGTGDGSNATLISTLFNSPQSSTIDTTTPRDIGEVSIDAYYNAAMTKLGVDSQSMDDKVTAQDDVVEQVEDWRSSVSGVDWNEELSNMIKFQQGYQASARCLTTMDEMLDKLVNSTGMVGR